MAEEGKSIMLTRKELFNELELLWKDGKSLAASFSFENDNLYRYPKGNDIISVGDSLKSVMILTLFLLPSI